MPRERRYNFENDVGTLTDHSAPVRDNDGNLIPAKTHRRSALRSNSVVFVAARKIRSKDFQNLFITQIWVLFNSCPSRNLTLTVFVCSGIQVTHSKTRFSQSTSSVGSARTISIGNPHEGQWCSSKCGGNF